MRTCVYENGDQVIYPGSTGIVCPNFFNNDDGDRIALVDWYDTIEVTTNPPYSALESLATLLTIGVLAVTLFGKNK